MSTRLKFIFYSVVAWIIALAACLILPVPIISELAGVLSLLTSLTLLIVAVISLVKDKHRIFSLLAMLLVLTTAWLAVTRAFRWGAWAHFQLNRGKYEAMVSKVLAVSDEAERNKICGDECWILSNDSNRVAFHYSHGFLNWTDVVYDPTAAVTEQDYTKKKQINVYLIHAEHLSGNWYLVHFGD